MNFTSNTIDIDRNRSEDLISILPAEAIPTVENRRKINIYISFFLVKVAIQNSNLLSFNE